MKKVIKSTIEIKSTTPWLPGEILSGYDFATGNCSTVFNLPESVVFSISGARDVAIRYNIYLDSDALEVAEEMSERVGVNGWLVTLADREFYSLPGFLSDFVVQGCLNEGKRFSERRASY